MWVSLTNVSVLAHWCQNTYIWILKQIAGSLGHLWSTQVTIHVLWNYIPSLTILVFIKNVQYYLFSEPNLKLKMQIQLINFAGLDEAGIDGGGIFREFMSELIKTAFDANRGFFKITNDRLLYPNPQAGMFVEDYTQHYYFIGRILGKVHHTCKSHDHDH